MTDKKTELFKFIKFGLVGILNTLLDSFVLNILVFGAGFDKSISKVIAYLIAMVNSYLFNKYWTFKASDTGGIKQITIFVIVNLISLGASLLVLNLTTDWVGVMLGYIPPTGYYSRYGVTVANLVLVAPISIIVNFLGNRLFVFNKK